MLPYASTTEADAVSRIFVAWQWLENPYFISYSGWGPLHFYLLAGALFLWFDPVYSPIILHILFSVFTAVPLWMFVRREWDDSAALFVAVLYLFYPIAFRFSFMAISEIPFTFFVALTMLFLSKARTGMNKKHALLAGLSITLAAALRYEAYVLIPLFALVLWRRWDLLAMYLVVASIFPVLSIVSNVLDSQDPLAGVAVARKWQVDVAGINENLSGIEILRRLIYFPSSVFFGLTPPVFLLCMVGIAQVWKSQKEKLVWLIPFLGLLLVFIIQCAQGHALMRTRYSIVLGLLLLPFSGQPISTIRDKRKALSVAELTLLLILPFSYSRVILARVAGLSFPNPFPPDMEIIPKVENAPKEIVRIVQDNLKASDGLIIDFFGSGFYGWKDTYYVALMGRVHPDRIHLLPGGRYEQLEKNRIAATLKMHPSGILLHSNQSRFLQLRDSTMQIENLPVILDVKPIQSVRSITIYRYAARKQ